MRTNQVIYNINTANNFGTIHKYSASTQSETVLKFRFGYEFGTQLNI